MVPWVSRHCTCDLGPRFPGNPRVYIHYANRRFVFQMIRRGAPPGAFLLSLPVALIVQRDSTRSINYAEDFSRCRASVTLGVMVSMLHFDILWNLITSDEALRPARPEQQCYPLLCSARSASCTLCKGEGCLLSCYYVYAIHYLLTASRANYKAWRCLLGVIF